MLILRIIVIFSAFCASMQYPTWGAVSGFKSTYSFNLKPFLNAMRSQGDGHNGDFQSSAWFFSLKTFTLSSCFLATFMACTYWWKRHKKGEKKAQEAKSSKKAGPKTENMLGGAMPYDELPRSPHNLQWGLDRSLGVPVSLVPEKNSPVAEKDKPREPSVELVPIISRDSPKTPLALDSSDDEERSKRTSPVPVTPPLTPSNSPKHTELLLGVEPGRLSANPDPFEITITPLRHEQEGVHVFPEEEVSDSENKHDADEWNLVATSVEVNVARMKDRIGAHRKQLAQEQDEIRALISEKSYTQYCELTGSDGVTKSPLVEKGEKIMRSIMQSAEVDGKYSYSVQATEENVQAVEAWLFSYTLKQQSTMIKDLSWRLRGADKLCYWLMDNEKSYSRISSHCPEVNKKQFGFDFDIVPLTNGKRTLLLIPLDPLEGEWLVKPENMGMDTWLKVIEHGGGYFWTFINKISPLRKGWNYLVSAVGYERGRLIHDDHPIYRKERVPQYAKDLVKLIFEVVSNDFLFAKFSLNKKQLFNEASTRGIYYMGGVVNAIGTEDNEYQEICDVFLNYLKEVHGEEDSDVRKGNEGIINLEKIFRSQALT